MASPGVSARHPDNGATISKTFATGCDEISKSPTAAATDPINVAARGVVVADENTPANPDAASFAAVANIKITDAMKVARINASNSGIFLPDLAFEFGGCKKFAIAAKSSMLSHRTKHMPGTRANAKRFRHRSQGACTLRGNW
jgi:hypothetical protein